MLMFLYGWEVCIYPHFRVRPRWTGGTHWRRLLDVVGVCLWTCFAHSTQLRNTFTLWVHSWIFKYPSFGTNKRTQLELFMPIFNSAEGSQLCLAGSLPPDHCTGYAMQVFFPQVFTRTKGRKQFFIEFSRFVTERLWVNKI